jgi:hypothetical protein
MLEGSDCLVYLSHFEEGIYIHPFIHLHSMDPYTARKPVDIEIVNDNKTSHVNNIITNNYT